MIAHADGHRLSSTQQEVAVKYLPLAQAALRRLCNRWPAAQRLDLEGLDHDCLCRIVMRYPDDALLLPRLRKAIRRAVTDAVRQSRPMAQLQGDVPDYRGAEENEDWLQAVDTLSAPERELFERWRQYPTDWSIREVSRAMAINHLRLWRMLQKVKSAQP